MKKIIRSIIKGVYIFLRGIYRLLPLPKATKARIRTLLGRAAAKLQRLINYDDPAVLHRYAVYEYHINEKNQTIEENNQTIDNYTAYVDTVFQTGKKCEDFVEYKKNNISFTDDDVKPIASYLTQFHTIPENDEWWGKGFTEWTNVTKAVPLFPGHYQPHLPLETFYDLSNIDVMRKQVELAKNYGIYGFLFHYYWFSGKRMLEKPLENFLNDKEGLDFPFCINWANHSWTRIWDASEDSILIEQQHSEEDDLACIADISRFLTDERYIRVNGKPFISIFNPKLLPDPNRTISIWRDYCRKNGIGEIHLVGMDNDLWDPLVYDFDGAIASSPNDIGQFHYYLFQIDTSINGKTERVIFDMERYIGEKTYLTDGRNKLYKGIIPGFDNTARRSDRAFVMDVKPGLYREWLYDIIQSSKENFEAGNRFVFINAWNEWAEGAHLEPCRKYGYAYLQATADAVVASRGEKPLWHTSNKRIIFVSHDASLHGAQKLSLSIIKQLTEVFKYEVYTIVKTAGELINEMRQYSKRSICLSEDNPTEQDLKKWIYSTGAKKAMCNTVVTGDVLKTLSDCGVTCISMIHEMEKVIQQHSCESNLHQIIANAKKMDSWFRWRM